MTKFRKLITVSIGLVFILTNLNANAQVKILQNAIDKLDSYNKYSFQSVYKQKQVFGDTLIMDRKFSFLKVPENSEIGYFFSFETKYGDMKAPTVELYDGKNLSLIFPIDSTYVRGKYLENVFSQSLLVQLNGVKKIVTANPSKLSQLSDTTFNSISSHHLVINVLDTLINNEHVYIRRHIFIDTLTGLPVGMVNRSRTNAFGKEISDYYTEDTYFNYQIEQNNINAANFVIPAGYHPPIEKKATQPTNSLAVGKIAPDWTLYDTDDKKTSLSQLNGKVVLLNFFFVGCVPCGRSLPSLDNLQKKYKNKDFLLLSISTRDNKKLVKEYKDSQRITNQMFPNGNDVANLYHADGAPTFYLLDQEGKIASIIQGYADDFEEKITGTIDTLIVNHK